MAWDPFIPGINIISCNEIEVSRDGTPFVASHVRTYKRQFRVIVDNPLAESNQICQAGPIPLPFAPYTSADGGDYDVSALCVKIAAAQQVPDDRMHWIVTCDYSTEMPEGGPSACFYGSFPLGAQNQPELEPWVISWEPETITKAYQYDRNGNAFTSSAGKPFKPAPSYQTARAVLCFTRNQLTFGREQIVNYSYAVNSDDFLGAIPGAAQCMPPTGKLMFRGNTAYWRVTWKVKFGGEDPSYPDGVETFDPVYLLDQDTFRLQDIPGSPDLGKAVPILRHGVPVTDPLLLNGIGQPIGVDDRPEYREFNIYRTMPFNALFVAGLGLVTP